MFLVCPRTPLPTPRFRPSEVSPEMQAEVSRHWSVVKATYQASVAALVQAQADMASWTTENLRASIAAAKEKLEDLFRRSIGGPGRGGWGAEELAATKQR